MNLNYNSNPEYILYKNLTDELINLYGIKCQLIITEKVQLDKHTFGEWQTLKATSGDVKEVYMLPENSESFDGEDQLFNQFGLSNLNEINLFISRSSILSIYPYIDGSKGYNDIVNDLIVLPSNKVLEITKIEPMVPGINNLYTFPEEKNVYKLYCTRYMFKDADNLSDALNKANDNNTVVTASGEEFNSNTTQTLDNYFDNLLSDEADSQDENGNNIIVKTDNKLGDLW